MKIQRRWVWMMAIACAGTLFAQDTLERALFLEQSAGDLDGAVAIYQKLSAEGSPATDKVQAQAMHNLALALLKKGDLQGAMQEQALLARKLPAFTELAQDARTKISAELSKPIGELKENRFHHFKTGVEFTLPPGVSITSMGQSSDNGESMQMKTDKPELPFLQVWIIGGGFSPEAIDRAIETAIGSKVQQRGPNRDSRVRYDEVKEHTVSGHRAITFVIDYTQNGQAMTELFTYAVSSKVRIQFRALSTRENLPLLKKTLDEMVLSASIP